MTGVAPPVGGEVKGASGTRVFRVLSGHSSAFVVFTGEREAILIDAGMEEDAGNLRATLAELGVEFVKAIFVTHAHMDHVAGVHVFEDAQVYASEAEFSFLKGETKGHGLVGVMAGKLPPEHAISADRLHALGDGESVTVGGVTVKAFATPGHTEGSMSYRVNNLLFVGDLVFYDPHGVVRLLPRMITPDPDRATSSVKELVQKLHDDEPALVLDSHSAGGLYAGLVRFAASK